MSDMAWVLSSLLVVKNDTWEGRSVTDQESYMTLNTGGLAHARAIIQIWKEDDNTIRPHSALQQGVPAVFAHSLAT
jgi:transposase InsO family protein